MSNCHFTILTSFKAVVKIKTNLSQLEKSRNSPQSFFQNIVIFEGSKYLSSIHVLFQHIRVQHFRIICLLFLGLIFQFLTWVSTFWCSSADYVKTIKDFPNVLKSSFSRLNSAKFIFRRLSWPELQPARQSNPKVIHTMLCKYLHT